MSTYEDDEPVADVQAAFDQGAKGVTAPDLVTWLRQALDDDERAADAANVKQGDPDWYVSEVKGTGGEHFTVRSRRDNRPIARVQRLEGDGDEPGSILDGAAVATHIARHDPARVLADVAAKRAILDLHVAEDDPELGPRFLLCDECAGPQRWPCATVRLLAQSYADRPGYRDEWRPA